MKTTAEANTPSRETLVSLIDRHSSALAVQLQAHHLSTFPPVARKGIRHFQPSEAAKLVGVKEVYLRQVSNDIDGLEVSTTPGGRRSYSVEDIDKIRRHLDKVGRADRRYLPHRRDGEELQVISVMNFKGGSGKTTTSAHLAQYLALRGYRVLAVDLDPQASMSALYGHQPELDVQENETMYGAIRYDDARRPLKDIIRKGYIPGLDLVPGNLELMEFEHDTPRALMTRQPGDVMFFQRLSNSIEEVSAEYDIVIIDCPPQLGYLTLSALTAATSVLVTVHPQMLDVMSMNQFLAMVADLLREVASAGGNVDFAWMRYLITRFEPSDGPQNQMVGYLRSIFGAHVLNFPMLKSTAVSDAGLTNQTLYEVERGQFTRSTYDRALESMNSVNDEIETLVKKAWGRPT
ncbi:plasmid partitioning protein RepA [Ensifer sp. YR511]|uniref:plasmid partitioning protein RepA n=1 Tax=Ensifer sp. YR511 TaxID=1855294 RepID=UPI000B7DD554|nr:plasmid partitioning protein RepA [Ensifer sp. YR511]